jgi:CheY-like chemotaxis protein/HPt (histidine-containing phosphotransfer) domain-containing protein
MDGSELARQIQGDADLGSLRLVMLLAADRQENAAHYRDLGLDCFLTKPVKPSELLHAMLSTLSDKGAHASRRHSTAAPAAQTLVRPMHILLVEDNPVNQHMGVLTLEKNGHRVQVAGNGKLALAALAEQSFDLVLMDVQMPEMDGLQATEAIRRGEKATGKHIPIIAVTAHARKGDRERCLAAGMDSYVSKPIRPNELWREVASVCPAQPANHARVAPAPGGRAGRPGKTALVFNREELLDRLGGDRQVLREIVTMCLAECPRLTGNIRTALAAGSPHDVERAAHSLKGTMASIGANESQAAAARLETLARAGDLSSAEKTFAVLEQEMGSLTSALGGLLQEANP